MANKPFSPTMARALRYFADVERFGGEWYASGVLRIWGAYTPKSQTVKALIERNMITDGRNHVLTYEGFSKILLLDFDAEIDTPETAKARFAYAEGEKRVIETERARVAGEKRAAALAENEPKKWDGKPDTTRNLLADAGVTVVENNDMFLTEKEIQEMSEGDPVTAALLRKLAPGFGFTTDSTPTTAEEATLHPFADFLANLRIEEGLNAILSGVGAESAPSEDLVHELIGTKTERGNEAFEKFRTAVDFLMRGFGEYCNHTHDYGSRITFCTNLPYEATNVMIVQGALIHAAQEVDGEFIGLATMPVEGLIYAVIYTADDEIAKGGV